MKIGCLQFSPQVGDVDNNLNRADAVLNRANVRDLDLLVLPELAFSGYNFQSLEHIMPFLEPTGAGITALWARTVALKYNCTVIAGYPEKVDETTQEYYNSAIMVNADGDTLCNYRKSFLYYTDATWAQEGDGFYAGVIDGLGNVAIGICMDLNPFRFEAPFTAWEFAHHVLYVEANLVVLTMAWLTREDFSIFTSRPREPDMDTLSYWLARIEPVIRAERQGEIIVVFANRCGNEDGDVLYAGTSAVIGIDGGEVKVYGILGRGEKELLVVDTDGPIQAKLVSQRHSATSAKPADDIVTDALGRDPGYESDHYLDDPASPESPEEFYECISPVSATDSLLPQAYFGRTNLNLGPSLKSSIDNPGLASPTYQKTPVSGTSRYETPIGQPTMNSMDEILKPEIQLSNDNNGRPKFIRIHPEAFESSFTRNPLGPRSRHMLPRPSSTFW